jgi:hypothetical protein
VGLAVAHARARDDLAQNQSGQLFSECGRHTVLGAVVVGRDAIGGRIGVTVHMQRDEQIGLQVVGELRTVQIGRCLRVERAAGEVDPHAGGRQSAL